jgi:hypothetical protein
MCKVELLGNLENKNKHQSGNIYGVGGVAPNLMAGTHSWGMGYFLEIKKIKIKDEKNN